MVYATRAVMPLCVVAVSHEYQWTKTEMVTDAVILNVHDVMPASEDFE